MNRPLLLQLRLLALLSFDPVVCDGKGSSTNTCLHGGVNGGICSTVAARSAPFLAPLAAHQAPGLRAGTACACTPCRHAATGGRLAQRLQENMKSSIRRRTDRS